MGTPTEEKPMNHACSTALSLPKREGTRPKTHYAIPHHQIDQTPSAEIDIVLEITRAALNYASTPSAPTVSQQSAAP